MNNQRIKFFAWICQVHFGFLLAGLLLSGCSEAIEAQGQELKLRTEFGSEEVLSVSVDDIFAIWWDPKFDHQGDLSTLFGWLKEIRQDCLNNLGMADPPNPEAGYYYNVYIHHGKDDLLPEEWANGQGTDKFGMPFLTLPIGAHLQYGNVLHEGFHIFQYRANSPGFAYQGDSQWYIESAAQWYSSEKEPDDLLTFVEAGAIVSNPHLALWHSFSNEAPGDPKDWLFQVRQYGMHTYLHFLTKVRNVNGEVISGGFYAETELSPQEYHFQRIGGETLREHFVEWAAHNTGGLDYINEDQVARAWAEVDNVGDPDNLHPHVLEFDDEEAVGEHQPPVELKPRGWSYNVIKINVSEAATYTFSVNGDENGSEGATSHLEAKIVVTAPDSPSRYVDISMTNAIEGSGQVTVSNSDKEVYLVIAAVPEHFSGNQNYGYSVEIFRN